MAIRVIDTDVWSYLYKGRSEAKLYQPHILGNTLVISFQTQAELLRWAIAANWGQQRREHLRSRFARIRNRTFVKYIILALGGSNGQRASQRTTNLSR